MKNLAILFVLSLFTLNVIAQKVAKVTITTSASISKALEECKAAGIELKYGSKNFDEKEGCVTLWKYYFGGKDKELQIRITSKIQDSKTILILRMPHLPNTVGSYVKPLKKYVKKLNLPDKFLSEYFDGIE